MLAVVTGIFATADVRRAAADFSVFFEPLGCNN